MAVRVAMVGLGWWGQHLLRVLGRGGTGLEVVATVDPDPAKAASHPDLGAVLALPEVDAVVLCTPHAAHPDQIEQCAAAGKHVFCEKPIALRGTDAARAVAACRSAGIVLGVGHERRFEPGMEEVARLVADGELGTILHVEAAFSHDKFRSLEATSWRGSAQDAPAAGMTGMGIHLTDAFISMFGRVRAVNAYVARRVLPLESGDVVSVNLQFESGATGALSAVSATPFYARYAVFGSEGWAETHELRHPEEGSITTLRRRGREGGVVEVELDLADPTERNLRSFADAVAEGTPYRFTPEQIVHNSEVLEAIVRSSTEGIAVGVGGQTKDDSRPSQ